MKKHKLWDKVYQVIEDIRPFIQQDGGDIKLVKIDEKNIVSIKFLGACIGCGLLDDLTLQTITSIIRNEVPQINDVIVATDSE